MARATPVVVGWFAGRTLKITVSGVANVNYCVIVILHVHVFIELRNVVAGRGLETATVENMLVNCLCLLYTIHSTQYTVHNTQYTIHSAQYTVHSTQYTVHSTQYCALCIVYCVLYTVYCVLCTV